MGLVHELVLLTSVLVLLSPSVKCDLQCPEMWELWNTHCYMFSDTSEIQTHDEATNTCQKNSAWLLELETPEEAQFVGDRTSTTFILSYRCQLTGYLLPGVGFVITHWSCNGPENDPAPDFFGWQEAINAARLQDQDCVGLNTFDEGLPLPAVFLTSCSKRLHFVCEKEAVDLEDKEPLETTTLDPTLDASSDAIPSGTQESGKAGTNATTTIAEEYTATTDTTTSMEPLTPCEDQETNQTDQAAVSSSTFDRLDTEGRPQAGMCLQGHVIATRRARSRVACAAGCSRDARCRSFNFYKNEKRCELNFVESGQAIVDLVATNECVYMRRVQ